MPPRRASLVIAALLVLSACGHATPAYTDHPALNATAAPGLPTTVGALPSTDPAGFDALLAQLRGTPVVVNIWGSWCGPCRAEAPELRSAAAKYGHDVQFVGVDILDTREGAHAFMTEFGVPYPSLFDPGAAIRDRLGLEGQPDTLFYARDGSLAISWPGPIGSPQLEHGIRQILG